MERPTTTTNQMGSEKCNPLTTYVQTDTNTFREVVQRLTAGTSENKTTGDIHQAEAAAGTTSTKVVCTKKPTLGSKIHERRQLYTKRPKLQIVKPTHQQVHNGTLVSPSRIGKAGLISPTMATTPSSIFSKLSLGDDHHDHEDKLNCREEERAIQERRFYLHPSPRSKPGYIEPELLILFPLTSPETSENQETMHA